MQSHPYTLRDFRRAVKFGATRVLYRTRTGTPDPLTSEVVCYVQVHPIMNQSSSLPLPPPTPANAHAVLASRSNAPNAAGIRMPFFVAGTVLMVFTLLLAVFGVYFAWSGLESARWPEAVGTVVQTRIRTSVSMRDRHTSTARDREYYPEVVYHYTVGGKEFRSSRFALGETHPKYREREDAATAAEAFPLGSTVPVYYDPSDPESAVLQQGSTVGSWVPLGLSFLFGALGAVFLRLSMNARDLPMATAEGLDDNRAPKGNQAPATLSASHWNR